MGQAVLPQALHQNISKGKLGAVDCSRLVGGGAVTEQIQLMLLEAIFHFASGQ